MTKYAVVTASLFLNKTMYVSILKVFEDRKSATLYKNELIAQNPTKYKSHWQVAKLNTATNTLTVNKAKMFGCENCTQGECVNKEITVEII